jgi:hypothetical protein
MARKHNELAGCLNMCRTTLTVKAFTLRWTQVYVSSPDVNSDVTVSKEFLKCRMSFLTKQSMRFPWFLNSFIFRKLNVLKW